MFIAVARPRGACRGISGALRRKGWGKCCGYSEISVWSPPSVSIKDRIIFTLMARFDLYWPHVGFLWGLVNLVAM
jgi:hypothetical protein